MKLQILNKIKNISPINRQLLLMLLDFILIPISFYLTLLINQFENLQIISAKDIVFIILVSFFGILFYYINDLYRVRTRYIGSWIVYKVGLYNILFTITIFLFCKLINIEIIKLSVIFNFWIILTCTTVLIRFVLRDLFIFLESNLKSIKKNKVVIYGAGSAGSLLEKNLRSVGKYEVVFFIDDDSRLWKRNINKIRIFPFKYLLEKINLYDQIFLAIPSASISYRRRIINSLKSFQKPIMQVPSLEEITSGKMQIDELKPIKPNDLLGRDSVLPDKNLLKDSVKSKNILITGAGGSIGSELCRQIIRLKPKRLVLIDHSEHNLYCINNELEKNIFDKNLLSILGSTLDEKLLEEIIIDNHIEVIFHAAAYKHVPLVEINAISGIINNFLSTKILCNLSIKNNIEKFVLISTDKAVRPSSIMGASKRLAEIVVQEYSDINNSLNKNKTNNSFTKLSIVRFGNVLGSSGSVVPLFEKQISQGGPITLTHIDVERFFMSISEAALLVLQASAISEGGEVFLLDMGKPKKIYDLAKQMIYLSGLTHKCKDNPNGDIEIICTGLRPGEKLYEELLIDEKSENTKHPLIFKARERSSIKKDNISNKIELLENALENKNFEETLRFLSELVPEWKKYSHK